MKRDRFYSLNGTWKIGNSKIIVPFCPQSKLSEYDKRVRQHLIYEKEFELPDLDLSKRCLLHFGAVDQICEVYLNGILVGRHAGGYSAFYMDITQEILPGEVNRLLVKVLDSLSHTYPYGKQARWSHGMWYTQISGIWQSVWIEQVPYEYISQIQLVSDLNGVQYSVWIDGEDSVGIDADENGEEKNIYENGRIEITLDNGEVVTQTACVKHNAFTGYLCLTDHICADGSKYRARHWCPSDPYLYQVRIFFGEDTIESYTALRVIDKREFGGHSRVCLNGEPFLIKGVLDQGYYEDGHYLPRDEKEFEADILRMKEMGFNLLRKHIKIEPEAFYYACDRLGMLVMQDMVQSGYYSVVFDTLVPNITHKKRPDYLQVCLPKRRRIFERAMEETVYQLGNHPCIIMWTLFNEGWGQFETDRLFDKLRGLDRSRLIDAASGWFEQHKSDFISEHIYYKNQDMRTGKNPLLLSECGGFSLAVGGHIWRNKSGYGYGKCENTNQLMDQIQNMCEGMIGPYIRKGLCGFVYTQLSDVENEINGLYTYDREIVKVDIDKLKEILGRLDHIFGETISE